MKFVDTSFWIALFWAGDVHHGSARALWASVDSLLCTNHVLGETWTFLLRRRGHADAQRAVEAITRSPKVSQLHIERAIEEEAWTWLRRHDEREYSFVDATSFAVMRRRRLREALAFDDDFAAAGFTELRP